MWKVKWKDKSPKFKVVQKVNRERERERESKKKETNRETDGGKTGDTINVSV